MPRLVTQLTLCAALLASTAVAAEPGASVRSDFVPRSAVEPFAPPLAEAVAGLDTRTLAAHVAFLAAPALGGRGLGSDELEAALEYAASSLARAGVAAPEAGGRFQPVPIREVDAVTGGVTVVRHGDGTQRERTFAAGVDCLLPAVAPQTLRAGVVFAGYGIREPALGRDDTRGLELRGKIVLVIAGLPPGEQWRTKALESRYAAEDPDDRTTARAELAASLGAVAVLAVEPDDWSGHLSRGRAAASRFFLPFDAPAGGNGLPVARVSPAVAAALLDRGDNAARPLHDEAPRPLPGVEATIEVRGTERLVTSRNVLGMVPGADPALAGEVVLLGAHADHLGRDGGAIHPGADDNASGVAALLEIARAFASAPQPPRRTVAFAVWTGEEEGKLGSGHYVRHPVFPLARTTYLNLDMIGHPWLPEEIRTLVRDAGLESGEAFLAGLEAADLVEPGLPAGAPFLDAALTRAARGTGLALHFDRTDGTHGGSDYRDFARAGVPFVRFFGNFFPDYHTPRDTVESLDVRQVQRVARLALATAWLLANR